LQLIQKEVHGIDGTTYVTRFLVRNHSDLEDMAAASLLASELDAFREACQQRGIKATQQRLEIFREVAQSHEHPDAEAVFRGVQARLPTVSLDTVYRTLKMLTELGFIATLGPRQESLRFDANKEPHHHYVCVRCGKIQDVTSTLLDVESVQRVVRAFGSVQSAQLEVRGLCNTCATHESSSTQSS
jgi:Fur family peroxide stress response transcriptional regulator